MRGDIELARNSGKRRLPCRRVEAERQPPFVILRVGREEPFRQHEAENPVTQKFKPFIAGLRRAMARMGQRVDKKPPVGKNMPDPGFESGKGVVLRPVPVK